METSIEARYVSIPVLGDAHALARAMRRALAEYGTFAEQWRVASHMTSAMRGCVFIERDAAHELSRHHWLVATALNTSIGRDEFPRGTTFTPAPIDD